MSVSFEDHVVHFDLVILYVIFFPSILGVLCKKEMEKYVLVVRMQSRLITFECILCIECCLN